MLVREVAAHSVCEGTRRNIHVVGAEVRRYNSEEKEHDAAEQRDRSFRDVLREEFPADNRCARAYTVPAYPPIITPNGSFEEPSAIVAICDRSPHSAKNVMVNALTKTGERSFSNIACKNGFCCMSKDKVSSSSFFPSSASTS